MYLIPPPGISLTRFIFPHIYYIFEITVNMLDDTSTLLHYPWLHIPKIINIALYVKSRFSDM